jgi:hypothetical protein
MHPVTHYVLDSDDAVIRNVNRDRRQGIHWGLVNRLEDLDFADDLSAV